MRTSNLHKCNQVEILDSLPALLTVEAACSKHWKEVVLPLHDELVAFLRIWLPQLAKGVFLFPRSAKKKTWLMVKKDLSRIGIPYQHDLGIADFHAAVRHSYGSGLVQSGASVTQVKELARHGDIRMTLRYTHIGMDEKANALKGLPYPIDNDALQMRCISSGVDNPKVTSIDTTRCGRKWIQVRSLQDSIRQSVPARPRPSCRPHCCVSC